MISLLSDPLFLHALLAGVAVAIMCGPLGCFVVWRRLAYFGDAVAHAALLGVAGGLLLHTGTTAGIITAALVMAAALSILQRERRLASDALLGVLSHGALALALVLIAVADIRVDVQAYLFGDVLAVAADELFMIVAVAIVVVALLTWQWRSLVFMVVNEDIARVEGVPTRRLNYVLMLLIAFAVAAATPLVGILLITALLIIPAAAARHFAVSPGKMVLLTICIGALSVLCGLTAAFMADTPAGPSIILAAIAFFVLSRASKV